MENTEQIFSQMEPVLLEMARLHQKGQFYDWGISEKNNFPDVAWMCFSLPEAIRRRNGRSIPDKLKKWLGGWLPEGGSRQAEALMPIDFCLGQGMTGPWSDVYNYMRYSVCQYYQAAAC